MVRDADVAVRLRPSWLAFSVLLHSKQSFPKYVDSGFHPIFIDRLFDQVHR